MVYKRFVVLANSFKKQPGRCVAGRLVSDSGIVGDWFRPISELPEGELHPRHMRLADRSSLKVLDVVEAPVSEHAKDRIHPEDWHVDASNPWQRKRRVTAAKLAMIEDTPRNLWLDSSTRADRATSEFLLRQPKHQSLYLVRPRDFRVVLTNDFNPFEGKNQQKRRACFMYRGQDYSLGLTDPDFIDQHAAKFPAPNKPAIVIRPSFADCCLLCVSLTPIFNGYHYKVVATVIELP